MKSNLLHIMKFDMPSKVPHNSFAKSERLKLKMYSMDCIGEHTLTFSTLFSDVNVCGKNSVVAYIRIYIYIHNSCGKCFSLYSTQSEKYLSLLKHYPCSFYKRAYRPTTARRAKGINEFHFIMCVSSRG